ncbi:MAG TPA: dihydrofolate reductase family protein [Actinomycetota bacterium]
MRRIVASLFTTIDGVVESPEKWHFPYFDEEMGAIVGSLMCDTLLLGRKTYDTFAETWPPREDAGGEDALLARQIGDTRKIVVSRHPLEFAWRNSERLQGELTEAVAALKNETGGDIAISGSVSIVRQLMDAQLIDELHLLVDPVAVRNGMRLFEDGGPSLSTSLLSVDALASGVLHIAYGPSETAPGGTYRDASRAMASADTSVPRNSR